MSNHGAVDLETALNLDQALTGSPTGACMHTQQHTAFGIVAAAIALGAVADAVHAQPARVIAAETVVEVPVIEWVEISIHMPDGRVIVTKEKRFPSRSQIFARTGRLPIISIATSQGAGEGSGNSADNAGGSQTAVLVEGTGEGTEMDDGEPMSFVEAAPAGSSGAAEAGTVAASSTSSALSEIIQDDEPVSVTPAAAPQSTGAVRSFRKSSS